MNSHKQVLVIGYSADDSDVQLFKDAGYVVERAESIDAAIKKLGVRDYATVVLDSARTDPSPKASSLSSPALDNESYRTILEAVANNTEAGLVYLDRDFNFVWINETYARMGGLKREDFIGRNHFELYPNAENEAIFKYVRDSGERFSIKARPFEYLGSLNAGVAYWDWTLSPVKSASGELDGFALSLVDVTQNTIAEKNLAMVAQFPERNPAPVLQISSDGTLLYANASSECLLINWGIGEGDRVPRAIYSMVREALNSGLNVQNVMLCGDVDYSFTVVPIVEDDFVAIYANDITSMRRAQQDQARYIDRVNRLVKVTQSVLSEKTLQGLLQRVSDAACDLTGAKMCTVGYNFDGDDFKINVASRESGIPACPECGICISQRKAIYDELLLRKSTLMLSDRELRERPIWEDRPENCPMKGLLATHLVLANSQPNGLILLTNKQESDFTDEDEALFTQLSAIASLGLQHIELREEEQRRAAELDAVLSSLPVGVILIDTSGNVLIANSTAVEMIGAQSADDLAGWTSDRFRRETLQGSPISLDEIPVNRALRGEVVANSRLKLITPWNIDIIEGASASPVRDGQGNIIGAVAAFTDITDQVEFEKQRLVLFEREHHIAEMLQQALIPPYIPEIVLGYRVAARYEPALQEASVGGDFYDVFDLGNDMVGVLIGDVAGKGLAAAIRVAMARYAIRSYAYLDPGSPARVMALANAALCKERSEDVNMLTAFLAVLDARSQTIKYSSAGHEPPVICSNDGMIEELDVLGGALGIAESMSYTESARRLASNETLVMLTDGITEARRHGILFGKQGVLEVVGRTCDLSADLIADAILEAARTHAGGNLQDDAAIVVVGHDT